MGKIVFENTEEILEYLKSGVPEGSHGKTYYNPSFCDKDYQTCVEFLKKGWNEGAEKSSEILGSLETKLSETTVEKQDYQSDVSGDFFDVGVFLTGNPECWFNPVTVPTKQEEVKIKVNISSPYYVTIEQIYNRGACVLAVIDRLREKYFVNLEIIMSIHRVNTTKKDKDIDIVLKIDTNNLYSKSMLAFCLVHSGYLRRICFAIMEKHFGKNHLDRYGKTRDIDETETAIYFQRIKHNSFLTVEQSASQVQEIIENYNANTEN